MAEKQLDETTIREYLLGNIDPESELAESLDERMMMDRDFSALADRIEEEIIQDYLEGDLDPAERATMERHFLRPPERQKKLRRASLLNRHLAARGAEQEQFKPVLTPFRPIRLWTSYAGWVAALLLMITTGYLMNSQRAFQSEIAQKNNDLEQEREQAASAEAKLQSALTGLPQPVTNLNFYEHGVVRSDHSSFTQQIAVGTGTLHVELLLDNIIQRRCKVLLQSAAGKMTWLSQTQASPSGKYFALVFNVPMDGIAPGEYEFKVSQCISSEQPFPFQVSGL